ncbi:MAG: hypothetical protein AAFO07_10060 [Bacteroidota bacterium]
MRSIAQVISFVMHPLMIPTYMLIILMIINPYAFSVSSIGDRTSQLLIIRLFLSTFFIPAFAVLMLRFLGLVNSIELKEREERIGPYIITGIFYLWMFANFLNDSQIPPIYASFLLGATIALFLAFFINLFSKISAHTVGMGGLLGMVVLTYITHRQYDPVVISSSILGTFEMSMTFILMLVILLSGIVGTCRLFLQAHEQSDLYGGYLVGVATQFIAFVILMG